jgi:hypothetical protein
MKNKNSSDSDEKNERSALFFVYGATAFYNHHQPKIIPLFWTPLK